VETKDERDYREQRAKKICSGCAVVSACLEHALRNNENHGIWGGLNEAERRKLRAGE
jgi:WhiB family redox-sensing transcriptional regulator